MDEYEQLHQGTEPGNGRRNRLFRFMEDDEPGCEPFFAEAARKSESKKWQPALAEAVVKLLQGVEQRKRQLLRVEHVDARLAVLERKLEERSVGGSFVVPITSFAPEPFEVVKEIRVVVQPCDDEYSARFFDANVNAAGDNEQEAIDNLKDLLLSRFQFLGEQPPEELAPPLAKQIAVLREFIRRKS